MATTVGSEGDIKTLITNFVYLERDAIAAYDATIERLENPELKRQIEEFRSDHHRHLSELRDLAAQHGAEVPAEGDMKEMLTTGKVKMAAIAGDSTILKAMSSNESDTIAAYSSGAGNSAVPPEARPIFERGLEDERRHKAWMDSASS
ncbi:DUF892 family protein [Afifella marina]|uniref:Rubrerythrin n=1 Tax=Afifella marina DSM 2698 TaxID=1120955 RepID=A0A1G5MMF1_AFIMA|nr:ferritin-like domain-containing protein [Afifella marina]MBK1623964.1 rubrerythrin family protein [Afifella marina DSM 2698]MBK1627120.1 rubrerythrin family protein [Afifella marina]MBK5918851.1 rubrerythrin family protein [Afifella marina]RAI22545.1 rubrerythrin family protein [Afifella marina DSM 2698]SCZ26356.1 Rubrerythrin [Afifella marina DSM 2698]